MEIQSFFAGHPTNLCVLNLNHKFTSALDQPTADNISHIIIFDSRYRPLSLLNIKCDSCILAQEDQEVRRLFAELLDAGDTPFRGPPPKYEVDTLLPDYHEQDQERGQNDRPRNRANEQHTREEQRTPPRGTMFHEIFDDAAVQQTAEEPLINLAESETDDENILEAAENDTTVENLIEFAGADEVGPTVTARDFAYSAMDETTALAMLDRTWPAVIPERLEEPPESTPLGDSRVL
ncbi:MAG: hypothetical protein OHK93_004932 [Ramalina farinacea]|uniref:Uncharacterized protein n=1 Tax=Ramalina farinacea TaxID=258253 RepID=A0AA43QZJ2_9LECA|nr:hypothetical protein [Ramalina farinacea]